MSMPNQPERTPQGGVPGTLALDPAVKRGLRILTVDDERSLRESCKMFLESEGYSVEAVGRGGEALDLLRRRAYDILLIDLHMSGVRGWSSWRRRWSGTRKPWRSS